PIRVAAGSDRHEIRRRQRLDTFYLSEYEQEVPEQSVLIVEEPSQNGLEPPARCATKRHVDDDPREVCAALPPCSRGSRHLALGPRCSKHLRSRRSSSSPSSAKSGRAGADRK